MFGLCLHLVHEPRTLDRRGKAWIILDVRRDHQLAARLEARDQNRLQHGARGVDRGGIAGGSRSNDDYFGMRRVDGPGSCQFETPCAMASRDTISRLADPGKTQFLKNISPARLVTTFCPAARVCEAPSPTPRNASIRFRQVREGRRTGFPGLAVMLVASRRPSHNRLQG